MRGMRATAAIALLVGLFGTAFADVSSTLSQLAANDVNRGSADDVVLNYQNMASHTKFSHDNAPNPLFKDVSSSLVSGSTYVSLSNLLSQYTTDDIDTEDPSSPARDQAVDSFLATINGTSVFQSGWQFLVDQGFSQPDLSAFNAQLKALWFTPFARNVAKGSSGFESVFVGEIDNSEDNVIGLNNWYRLFLLEDAGVVNYHGWFTRANKLVPIQATIQFGWNDNKAMERSFLFATSPEFDFISTTIVALSGQGTAEISIQGSVLELTVETSTVDGVKVITGISTVIKGNAPVTNGPKTTRDPNLPTEAPGEFEALVNQMRAADEDKPAADSYVLDWGNEVRGKTDVSPNKLFTSVDESYFDRPVYAKLIKLYQQNVFTPDVCTEEPAASGFRKTMFLDVLDAWTNTTVFGMAHQYLITKGKADPDLNKFKDFLFTLWFGTYTRCKGKVGSSGFEHVYSGEWKSGEIDGQHNWVRFYQLEKAGDINYDGYYSYDGQLTGTFEYTWKNELKPKGGFLIGTSPPFDFSLLTMCALTQSGGGRCHFSIDGYPLRVTSYTQDCAGGGTCLSTAYPEDN